MAEHIGFRVIASPPSIPFVARNSEAENFEIRQAAIDCAQLLESKGWQNIRCVLVTSRVKQFEFDSSEEFTDIEWQCHVIGGTA